MGVDLLSGNVLLQHNLPRPQLPIPVDTGAQGRSSTASSDLPYSPERCLLSGTHPVFGRTGPLDMSHVGPTRPLMSPVCAVFSSLNSLSVSLISVKNPTYC